MNSDKMALVKPPKCHRIHLTRHGVRATQLPSWASPEPIYEGEDAYDAPLAKMGQRQADALAAFLSDKPLDYIFSSPFRRAIMTALPVARAKGLPIQLEWGLGERLEATWFSGFPKLPTPLQRHREEVPEVDPDYPSHVIPKYPETREEMLRRVAQTMDFLTHHYGPNILLVGHGASTAGARTHLNAEKTEVWAELAAGFCCHYEFSYVGDRWERIPNDPQFHLAAVGLLVTKEGSADV